MGVDESDFKKLLIDLDLSATEIARRASITSWAVTLYFRGVLKNAETRSRIKAVLRSRARAKKVRLPAFWTEAANR